MRRGVALLSRRTKAGLPATTSLVAGSLRYCNLNGTDRGITTMTRVITIVATGVAICLAMIVGVAGAATGPFTWSEQNWCPTWKTYSLPYCNSPENNNGHANVWLNSQVVRDNGEVDLKAVSTPYTLNGVTYGWRSGAINTDQLVTYQWGWFGEKVYVPCENGEVRNWPAFVVWGTVGSWPKKGEIDVMEGHNGHVSWNYHYVNAEGQNAQYGGHEGEYCGWHKFTVYRAPDYITWRYDGVKVGHVTPQDIGVPLASDPMYVSIEYGVPTNGDKMTGTMRVAWFKHTP